VVENNNRRKKNIIIIVIIASNYFHEQRSLIKEYEVGELTPWYLVDDVKDEVVFVATLEKEEEMGKMME